MHLILKNVILKLSAKDAEPNQSIAIKGEMPSEVKCGLQFSYYSGRGPDRVVVGKAWKVIKLKSLK